MKKPLLLSSILRREARLKRKIRVESRQYEAGTDLVVQNVWNDYFIGTIIDGDDTVRFDISKSEFEIIDPQERETNPSKDYSYE